MRASSSDLAPVTTCVQVVRSNGQNCYARARTKREEAGDKERLSQTAPRTIFPEAKISAVVLGSLIRMIAAAKRCDESIVSTSGLARCCTKGLEQQQALTRGLYSALRALLAIVCRVSLQPRLTVATKFCKVGTMPEGWVLESSPSALVVSAMTVSQGAQPPFKQNARSGKPRPQQSPRPK